MPFRFRRSISIFKGVRLNLSKRGASLSLGGRGLSVNLSDRGARTTVGLPGTGLSYTTSTKSGKLTRKPDEQNEVLDIKTAQPDVAIDPVNKQPGKIERQPNALNNHSDSFQYSEEEPSGLNLLFTTMLVVFMGGISILGLFYLVYYFFLAQ